MEKVKSHAAIGKGHVVEVKSRVATDECHTAKKKVFSKEPSLFFHLFS